jgi:hydroxymethylglutaryl-CoA lyase
LTALSHGIRTVDASVGGLGGCPYSPGATGNVATEDVLYALQGSQYTVLDRDGKPVNVEAMADIGNWISEKLGRGTASRAGKAIWSKKVREAEKAKAKL